MMPQAKIRVHLDHDAASARRRSRVIPGTIVRVGQRDTCGGRGVVLERAILPYLRSDKYEIVYHDRGREYCRQGCRVAVGARKRGVGCRWRRLWFLIGVDGVFLGAFGVVVLMLAVMLFLYVYTMYDVAITFFQCKDPGRFRFTSCIRPAIIVPRVWFMSVRQIRSRPQEIAVDGSP